MDGEKNMHTWIDGWITGRKDGWMYRLFFLTANECLRDIHIPLLPHVRMRANPEC